MQLVFLRAYAGHPDPVDTLVETDWERLVGAGLAGGYAGGRLGVAKFAWSCGYLLAASFINLFDLNLWEKMINLYLFVSIR